MCRTICLLVALLTWTARADGGLRSWKSKAGGSVIEAAFVKEEKGIVTLTRKDGVTIQAKLDALCDEDRAYVDEITYVPREVKVVFKRDRIGLGYGEVGASGDATLRDTAVLQVDAAAGDAPPDIKGDTSWKVESVDALGKRIRPQREGVGDELSTDGKFVFLMYRVKNDSLAPVDVPSPVLHDRQGRVFTQAERGFAQHYIPEGALLAGLATLQPGFAKLHCAFYELPKDAEPVAVEVFPSAAKALLLRQGRRSGEPLRGKKILLEAAAGADAPQQADEPGAVADEKTSLFMRCTRVGQSGDSTGQWYFDRGKKRSLTYGVEMRGLGDQAKKVTVKAFFVGEASGNRDLVLDKKESEVTLDPGKIVRLTLQSEEIAEQTYAYYYVGGRERVSGAKLKGVIIQAWAGSTMVSSWASLNQWRKFADSQDVAKDMGELKKSEDGF
jgi:hypothetical protein